jgi:hypothetical protein
VESEEHGYVFETEFQLYVAGWFYFEGAVEGELELLFVFLGGLSGAPVVYVGGFILLVPVEQGPYWLRKVLLLLLLTDCHDFRLGRRLTPEHQL